MAIQGELQSTDLSSIFQMLALNQTTGRLRVHDQRDFLKTRCLVLDGATLGVASMAPPSSGGLQWVDQGAISIEQWQGLFARATAQGTTVAAVAAAESALTDEQLSADSRQQQLDAILEVFLWPDVVFSLEELDSIPDQAGRVFFAVDRIVMESARRQDEWARASELLADGEHILHPNPRRQAAGDAPVDLPETSVDLINGVAEFVDGVRGLDEIARATGLSRYTTGICLASMMARGELAWMALDELLITGDRLMRDGRSSDALRLFQSALRFDRRNLAIHKRLASAYENLGQIGRASAHFRFCGLLLRRRGSLREAYDLTVRAHQLVPTNFRALRSAIELLAQMDSPLDATDEALLATARQLFHFHADAANLKQARQVGSLILHIAPNDLAVAVEHARILARSNLKLEAADAYCRISEGLSNDGNTVGAISLLHTAIDLDPSRRGQCSRRIRALEETEAIRAQRRRRGRAALTVAAVSLLFALGYFYHHNSARAAFEVVRSGEGELDGEAAWMGQAERYSDVATRYPFTSAALQARSLEDNARGRALVLRQVVWEQRQAEEKQVALKLAGARQSLVTGLTRQTELDFNGALACFVTARDIAVGIEAVDWLQQHEVEGRIADLQAHLAKEAKVLATLDGAIEAGQMEQAHDTAMDLLGHSGSDPLDVTDIHVVSRSCLDRIRVPYQVVIVPQTATLSVGGSQSDGALMLSESSQNVTLRSQLANGREATLDLNWRDVSHYQLLSIPNEPVRQHRLGQRVVDIVRWKDLACAVCADGSVRFLTPSSDRVKVLPPVGGMVAVQGPAVQCGASLYVAGSDGSIRCALLDSMIWGWSWKSDDVDIRVVGVDSMRLIVASSRTLWAIDSEKGAELWSVPLSHEIVTGGVIADSFWSLDNEGSIHIQDTSSGAPVARVAGPFDDVLCTDTGSLICFEKGNVCNVRITSRKIVARKVLACAVEASATMMNGQVVWLNTEGTLVMWDGTAEQELHRVLTLAKGVVASGARLSLLGDGTLAFSAMGSRILRLDPRSGELLSAHLESEDSARRACMVGSTFYFSADRNEGVVGVYHDE